MLRADQRRLTSVSSILRLLILLALLISGASGVFVQRAAAAETVAQGLPGTPFGTGPAWSPGSEYDKVFDNNTSTFFDYVNANDGYTGIDLGAGNAKPIVKIAFHPRGGYEWRMPGGKFQGSNTGPDSGYVDLHIVDGTPPGSWNEVAVSDPTPYRWLRYLAPPDSYANIAEIEFYDRELADRPPPPPAPWASADIGNTGAAGNAGYRDGVFTVSGAGGDIGGSYDQFHYVYQPLNGDGQIVARISGITSGNANTKAAVVIRETLDGWPPARKAIMGLTEGNGAFFAARSEPQTNATYTAGPTTAAPAWVKLTRAGNSFTGYLSADGATWSQVGSATIPMAQNAYIGLAAGGETYGVLATSTFDQVRVFEIASTPVSVTVNWDSVQSKTTEFSYGLNGFNAYNPPEIDSAYNANLQYMNPGVFRMHSWEMMGDSKTTRNGWIDQQNQRWDAQKIDAALTNLTADGLVPLINIPAWPSWMDKNNDEYLDADQFDAYAQWCAELVRIVNVQGKHNVQFWEPTNERDDLYYVHLRNAGQPDRLDELIDIYNRAARAMKAVDPSIKVGGLAFARPDLYEQVQRFVAGTVNQRNPRTLDFVSIHGYASGDQTQSDTHIYDRAAALAQHAADIRAILDTASPDRRIGLWFDEYNVSWCFCNNDPRMQNNKGAVFDALMLVQLHHSGVDATMAWNERDGVYGKTDNDGVLRPSAHLFHLMNQYMRGQVVATTTSNAQVVQVFAVRNPRDGTFGYLVINRSSKYQPVNTRFLGRSLNRFTVERHEIGAAGYTETSIDGQTLTSAPLLIPDNSVTLFVAKTK